MSERLGMAVHFLFPGGRDLFKDRDQRHRDVPTWKVIAKLGEITVIADMITDAIFIKILIIHRLTTAALSQLERLEDAATVFFSTADVVDLARARRFDKAVDESSDIFAMDVVPYLFAFVAKHFVLATFQVALDQIAEETVQLDA